MGRRKNQGRAINGMVLLDKPLGISSNFALQQVKRLFQANKAGHTGSLDPLATGLLPICLGEATKISAYLLDADKRYQTVAQLGQTTRTGDKEGEIIQTRAVPALCRAQVETVLHRFRGAQRQVPPMYSALKRHGQPLYHLARQGLDCERAERHITVYELILDEIQADTLTLTVACSKGTYIRTLVEDIGEALGCGSHVAMLRRTAVAGFTQMVDLATLQQAATQGMDGLDSFLLPLDSALAHWPKLQLPPNAVQALRQGRLWDNTGQTVTGVLRLHDEADKLFAIGEALPTGQLKPKRLLFL